MLVIPRPFLLPLFSTALVLSGCAPVQQSYRVSEALPESAAMGSIEAGELLRHIKTLASDEFEGRAPGTRGEELTVNYLVSEFKRLGLKSGNPDGTYVQNVPLVGITSDPKAYLTVGEKRVDWVHKQDYVGSSLLVQPTVKVQDSELVFVGYGVVAPEYDWDDYKGADVRGKTLVILMNDPQMPDPNDPAKLDPKMFKGVVKTYYSTGRHKREVAVPKGALARITVHEAEHAGWPFSVALSDAGREDFDIKDQAEPQFPIDSMIPVEKARELFGLAGYDFDSLRKLALRKDFRPVALGTKASFEVKNSLKEVPSRNVVARIEGRDPEMKDEYVIYTAHWDHLGRDPNLKGDQVYHGALDNASGVAALLEIAKVYTRLPEAPRRSILFMATTAEEAGLLGAKYYVTHPLYPLSRTLVDLNIDVINAWGRTRDFEIVGLGETDLDVPLEEVAASQGKVVRPDSRPELGLYYRQDALEFARGGLPSLYIRRGADFIGKPPGYGKEKANAYIANDYHKVTDTVRPDWDLSGAVEFTRFAFAIGYRLAQGGPFPQWLPGTEFKAKRDAMMNVKQEKQR